MTRHVIIPDVQARPGDTFDFLAAAGNYIAEKKPDVIVQIGDFADMPSLSSYDVGKKSFEGRKYTDDIESSHDAMAALVCPIVKERVRLLNGKRKRWNPRMVLTLGNHESRIGRAIEDDRKLEGLISIGDLRYEEWGWEVYPFLQPVVIDGVSYCHYQTSGVMGRPITSARGILSKKHMSCIVGHQQGKDIAYAQRGDGKTITSIIAGSFYEHEETYLNHQTNQHWRGIIMLNEVEDGQFDEMFVSLKYLKGNYL